MGPQQIQQGKTEDLVGTSPRLIAAYDMYATGAGEIDTASRLYGMEEHWLPRGK